MSDNPDIQATIPRLVGYIVISLLSATAGFMAASLLTTQYILTQFEPRGEFIAVHDPHAAELLEQNSQIPAEMQEPYSLRLTLQKMSDDSTSKPPVLLHSALVAAHIQKDTQGSCYFMYTNLAYQIVSLKDLAEDPSLANSTMGFFIIPCPK